MTAPTSHQEEAHKLVADAEVDLWIVQLKNSSTIIRFVNREELTWQGQIYEAVGCTFSGDDRAAEGQEPRPVLTVLNPAGLFSPYIKAGQLDLATVIRRRVLRKHLEANLNIYDQRMWYVAQIRDVISGQSFSAELRSMSEGPDFMIPARAYYAPEFPLVSI